MHYQRICAYIGCKVIGSPVNAIRGARKDFVSEIAGVESPRMAVDAAQARLLGK